MIQHITLVSLFRRTFYWKVLILIVDNKLNMWKNWRVYGVLWKMFHHWCECSGVWEDCILSFGCEEGSICICNDLEMDSFDCAEHFARILGQLINNRNIMLRSLFGIRSHKVASAVRLLAKKSTRLCQLENKSDCSGWGRLNPWFS